MRHTVKLQNVIIGWSDLEQRDPSVGRAWGHFRPGVGYELVDTWKDHVDRCIIPFHADRSLTHYYGMYLRLT